MDYRLRRVFDFFADEDIAIIGSATRDVDAANDIDVLFLSTRDFPQLAEQLGTTYNGWNQSGFHLRRINYQIPDIEKPVQLLWYSHISRFADHPHCVMLRDGTRLNDGVYWSDPNPHVKRYQRNQREVA